MIKIYLDDLRYTPHGWLRTYTVDETIQALQDNEGNVEALSLDNDLGFMQKEGHKVAEWLEKVVMTQGYPAPEILIAHTANIVARAKMETIFNNIRRYVDSKNDS